ncbi:MAG: serine hydrolase domain-containing protein [Rhodosalinus sp.]
MSKRLVAPTGAAGLFSLRPRKADAHPDDIGYQITVSDGETVEQVHGGLAAPGRSVTDRTLFQAASCSKPVAALAAMTLVGDGRLDLDRPVNDYLTRWKLEGRGAPRATAAALMSHTAGTSISGFPGYPGGTPVPTLIQILDGVKPANTDAVRADRLFCGRYRYSGGGSTVLQLLIAEISKQSFADYARTAVLEPLGVSAATFDLEPAGEIALGHRSDGRVVEGGFHRYPESAAAGLWCRAVDLARIMAGIVAAVRGEKGAILPVSLAKRMISPVRRTAALGVFSDRGRAIWHDGSNAGYRSLMTADVGTGCVIGAVSNSDAGMATITRRLKEIRDD